MIMNENWKEWIRTGIVFFFTGYMTATIISNYRVEDLSFERDKRHLECMQTATGALDLAHDVIKERNLCHAKKQN